MNLVKVEDINSGDYFFVNTDMSLDLIEKCIIEYETILDGDRHANAS